MYNEIIYSIKVMPESYRTKIMKSTISNIDNLLFPLLKSFIISLFPNNPKYG